jgi:hypothetical protein
MCQAKYIGSFDFCTKWFFLFHLEFGEFANTNPKYWETLQNLVALIAYPNPYESPLAHYLSQSRREEVAELVNNHILGFIILYSILWLIKRNLC